MRVPRIQKRPQSACKGYTIIGHYAISCYGRLSAQGWECDVNHCVFPLFNVFSKDSSACLEEKISLCRWLKDLMWSHSQPTCYLSNPISCWYSPCSSGAGNTGFLAWLEIAPPVPALATALPLFYFPSSALITTWHTVYGILFVSFIIFFQHWNICSMTWR